MDAPGKSDHGISTYARLAAGACPPAVDLQLALGRAMDEQSPCDAPERLDEDARTLFGIAAHDEAAAALVDGVWALGYRPIPDSGPSAWLLDRVVRVRRGHPVLMATVLCALARRAGLAAGVASDAMGWYVRLGDPDVRDELVSVGFAGISPAIASSPLRSHCAHELAFVVLRGLEQAHEREGEKVLAARAAGLRTLLPVARHA